MIWIFKAFGEEINNCVHYGSARYDVGLGSSPRFQINLEEVYSKLRKLKDPTFKPKEGNPYEACDGVGV